MTSWITGTWSSAWRWPLPQPSMPMHQRLARIRAPANDATPVSVKETVLHLRLAPEAENGPEKPLLEMLIAAATGAAEHYASIAIMLQHWRLTMPDLPRRYGYSAGSGYPGTNLQIPLPPFTELLSFKVHGVSIDPDDFIIELDDRLPATIYPKSRSWPPVSPSGQNAVAVEFSCGHEKPADVPPLIKQAVLMAIGSWYENRESLQQFTLTPLLELGWEALLNPYRLEAFA